MLNIFDLHNVVYKNSELLLINSGVEINIERAPGAVIDVEFGDIVVIGIDIDDIIIIIIISLLFIFYFYF